LVDWIPSCTTYIRQTEVASRYLETRDKTALKNINQHVIKSEIKPVNYKKRNNNLTDQCKLNLKAFWKHINSKRKIKTSIGDLNSVDVYGYPITVSTNIEKAEVLGDFFSSVFTVEKQLNSSFIQFEPCHSPI